MFGIKDLGLLHYFLGIEFGYVENGIVLSQQRFAKEILSTCDFDLSKSATTPLPLHSKLNDTDGDLLPSAECYRSWFGKLNYLTNTRLDLAYAVQTVSQFLHKPRTSHLDALHHILRYVFHTSYQGILLKVDDFLTVQAFSDSDWASCPDTRRSITSYLLLFGQSPVSWKSKKQSTVSRSSSEAEYRVMASAISEVTWLIRLLEELGVTNLKLVQLHCDN